MMTEPHPTELYPPPGEPVPCAWCGGPIVNTPIGWLHLDQYRALDGWLCPEPHMHIAEPRTEVTLAIEVGTASVAAEQQPRPSPRTTEPSRRPTPIPPRKGAHQGEATSSEWPPSPDSGDWWERR